MSRFLFVCLVFSFSIMGTSGSRLTFERSLTIGISTGVRLFVATNKEFLPTKWTDLWATDIDEVNKQLHQRKMEPLQGLYVFTPTNPIISFSQKQIIVARFRPIKEDGTLGRYVVCKNLEGYIYDGWVDEAEFQKMLNESNVKLPDPDPMEVAAAKAAVESLMAKESAEKKAVDELILQNVPPPPAGQVASVWWQQLKNVFVDHPASGGGGRAVPLVIAGLFLFGGGVYLLRRLRKRS